MIYQNNFTIFRYSIIFTFLFLFLNEALCMNFKIVADYFDKIEIENSRLKMTELLAELFKKASPREVNIIANFSLGLLRPPYQGMQFNFASKQLTYAIADVLDSTSDDITKKSKELGDLGKVLASGTWKVEKELTVLEVYDALSEFEKISGMGSQEEKMIFITQLFKKLEPSSAKYIARIILGTLRLGFSDMTIIDAYSWMEAGNKSLRARIEHAYNICADIGLIGQILKKDGMTAIDDMHIKVGIPIRPAAAERLATAQAVFEKLGPCIAQPKLDGFRLQIHIDNREKKHPIIKFFSRNLIDMSYMFPDLVDALKNLQVDELIVEGEAIVFDPNTGSFLPFQETVKRKRKHGIEQAVSEFPLQVYMFDLLYVNGTSYLNNAHKTRRKELTNIFKNLSQDRIQVIDEVEINNVQELEHYFMKNIGAGLEGLVVKKPGSHYQPGKRNFNWIKLKRQEEGELADTIDCVILGYYAGRGKRAQFGIGAFLVGIYNKSKDMFQTIAKIGTGLSDKEWIELKEKCDTIAVDEQPKFVECAKELIPDVWVAPEIVCSIRADEITLSPIHIAGKTKEKLGYALRFPRFVVYRSDKSAQQSTSIQEIEELFELQFQKEKRKKR